MDDDKHIILHHLDDPLRILHWMPGNLLDEDAEKEPTDLLYLK